MKVFYKLSNNINLTSTITIKNERQLLAKNDTMMVIIKNKKTMTQVIG